MLFQTNLTTTPEIHKKPWFLYLLGFWFVADMSAIKHELKRIIKKSQL